MLLSDFDPIQHYCMVLISENKGYSPRLGLILYSPAQAKGHLHDVSVLVCFLQRFCFVFFTLLSYVINISCILAKRALVDSVFSFF